MGAKGKEYLEVKKRYWFYFICGISVIIFGVYYNFFRVTEGQREFLKRVREMSGKDVREIIISEDEGEFEGRRYRITDQETTRSFLSAFKHADIAPVIWQLSPIYRYAIIIKLSNASRKQFLGIVYDNQVNDIYLYKNTGYVKPILVPGLGRWITHMKQSNEKYN